MALPKVETAVRRLVREIPPGAPPEQGVYAAVALRLAVMLDAGPVESAAPNIARELRALVAALTVSDTADRELDELLRGLQR